MASHVERTYLNTGSTRIPGSVNNLPTEDAMKEGTTFTLKTTAKPHALMVCMTTLDLACLACIACKVSSLFRYK